MKHIFIFLFFAQALSAQVELPSYWPPDAFEPDSAENNRFVIAGTDIEPSNIFVISDGGSFEVDPFVTYRYGWQSLSTLDCEPYEVFSEWVATNEGKNESRIVHWHEWVYAERYDVNEYPSPTLTLAIDCITPCGPCPESENEARICSNCLRHETRVRSWGYRAKEKTESKYMELKKKIKE